MTTITPREQAELDRANASGRQPVVFIHGLWLLPSSWDAWRAHVEERGYIALAPGWPDDPDTVAEARSNPQRFAGKGVGQIVGHLAEVIRGLDRAPILIGHSFGGLFVQKLAGLGLAAATVAIDPAPFKGVLPLPLSALRASSPVLLNPLHYRSQVMLSEAQFRYAFTNAVDAAEAHRLYDEYAVPCSGIPLFQAATANLNPRTEVKVDVDNPDRGPLLILSGEKDNTIPWAISNAEFKRYKNNPGVTEIAEVPDRGHALTIDDGWREVADLALDFVRRFV